MVGCYLLFRCDWDGFDRILRKQETHSGERYLRRYIVYCLLRPLQSGGRSDI